MHFLRKLLTIWTPIFLLNQDNSDHPISGSRMITEAGDPMITEVSGDHMITE